jgi:DNA-binding response OmpR family regulator
MGDGNMTMSLALLVESDWSLLSHAFGVFRPDGYEIVVEGTPDNALQIARRSRPKVIIVPAVVLDAWDKRLPGGVRFLLASSAIIATVDAEHAATALRKWAAMGCEILIMPLVHHFELYAAVQSALDNTARRQQKHTTAV